MKNILRRNIWFYLVLVLVFAKTVDWNACVLARGKYLLGIFYNGHFQNSKDGAVYQDYLKRHGLTHEEFEKNL